MGTNGIGSRVLRAVFATPRKTSGLLKRNHRIRAARATFAPSLAE